MSVIELFSRRMHEQRKNVADVLTYDTFPDSLRVQIIHILNDSLGDDDAFERIRMVKGAYTFIVNALRREYGFFELPPIDEYSYRSELKELQDFILNETDVERVLDAVELACGIINKEGRDYSYRGRSRADEEMTRAIEELNYRLKQHGLGYRYDVPSKQVIRVDSELVHAEIVKPALALLSDPRFAGVQEEFLKAYEHYRHRRQKEALAEALKSLESMAKTIAKLRGWASEPKATSKALIDLLFEKELVPKLWAQQFGGLRSMLESGVPTARNRLGGHGQGNEVVDVPDHYVAFALHQTAAALVFLDAAERALPASEER